MPLTKRPGELTARESIRENVSELPSAPETVETASAFLETNTRPTEVATQSVPVSLGARVIAATTPKARLPRDGCVRSLAGVLCPVRLPSSTQSPQRTVGGKSRVNSLQCGSSVAWGPPLSVVRQTP